MTGPGDAVIAGYRIVRVLGVGGMGTVYLAEHPSLPRKVALKLLSTDLSRNPEFRARFLREAEVASSLEHPNIVAVYDRGQTASGQLWIAMQFVDGTDADAASRGGGMSPDRAVHVITEVAKALDYAHAHHVVHRDVKPANFLLSGGPGPQERVLLGDFGIARALDDVGLTSTGSLVGTVAYAAPEVLAGLTFDGRADVYSLGCTLFRLLTGKPPFPSTNGIAAVLAAHLHAPPPRVTDFVPSLPVGLDAVVAAAMAKDPGLRPPTATAFARAAATALHEPRPGPVTPPRASALQPLPAKRRSRRRVIAWSAATAAVAIAATAVAVGVLRNSPVAVDDRPETQASSPASPPTATITSDISAAQLRAILLPADEIATLTGASGLVLDSDGLELLGAQDVVEPASCTAAWIPAQRDVYAARLPTGVAELRGSAVQMMRAANARPWQDGLIQAVTAFDRTVNASTFRQLQQRQWTACAATGVSVRSPDGQQQSWTVTTPATTAGVNLIELRPSDGSTVCQRAMTLRSNVVIDVRQCATTTPPDVVALVNALAARVPTS